MFLILLQIYLKNELFKMILIKIRLLKSELLKMIFEEIVLKIE